MRGRRAFPMGTWVVHSHGPEWHAAELGAVRRFANGSVGGTYWAVPAGLPGIFLGRLRRGRRGGGLCELVTVLWMGRELLCRMDDLVRYEPGPGDAG